mgnify:FL=1
MSGGRSGPFARNLIGSEQECKSLEDIAHFGRSQDAEAITQSGLVDRSDLGDVYDARTRKSGFTLPYAHVAWHGSKPEVRCDCRDYSGGDGASIEAVVLYDKSGSAAGGC